jgi:phage terminase large subunit-like protein
MSAKRTKAKPAKRAKWKSYAVRAAQYCRDVVARKIPACIEARQACQRHLDDLVRSRSEEFKFKFDAIRAGRYCEKIERFPHVKGQWARESQPIHLEGWQCFITCSIFGWVFKSTGLRRFRQVFILVPRKNGKTIWAAAVGNIMFVCDDEPGAEVYCGAADEKQAHEVFSPACKMARRAPGFKEYFGISVAKKSMYVIDEGSKFEPVIGNPGDGPSPHCFIHDEFHQQLTDAQYNTAKTGMGARQQPLQIVISTAGVNVESPCYALQEDVKSVLAGDIPNDRLFAVIYTVDDPDRIVETSRGKVPYWATVEAAREANPNYGISVLAEFLDGELAEALQRASRQATYKTKHLNIWGNADDPWMDMEAWRRCADPSLTLDEFLSDPCYEGLDLGSRVDLTSRCKVFVKHDDDGLRHYFAFWRHYVPEGRANDGSHQHYERWLADGKMVGHPGNSIQLGLVEKEVEEDLGKFKYARLCFDPFQAEQMQQNLRNHLGENEKTPEDQRIVLTIPQNVKYLSPAMKEVEAAVVSGRFHHNGDPVASWGVSCVRVQVDRNENVFPRKQENRVNKIDPASALFDAFFPALAAVPAPSSNELIFF